MALDPEETETEAVLEAVRQGLHDKDAATIAAQYAPTAVIFDLAPPLAHPVDLTGLDAWLQTWEGPVEQELHSPTIAVSETLAFCHGLAKVRAVTISGGERAEWWQRMTVCLCKVEGAWKIVHEHTSVPFHMDGSFRAAIDLQP
jgi:ketosteroid isomerase-like protein